MRKVSLYDSERNYSTHNTIRNAAVFAHGSERYQSRIKRSLKSPVDAKLIVGGFMTFDAASCPKFEDVVIAKKSRPGKRAWPVDKYNLEAKLVKSYPSILSAARENGISVQGFYYYVYSVRSVDGYVFRYQSDEFAQPLSSTNRRSVIMVSDYKEN